jgi:hypothetical protein
MRTYIAGLLLITGFTAFSQSNTFPVTGNVGVGTTTPRGHFDVDGAGDIYLSDDVNAGANQSLFLPGHIYIAPFNGGNVSYLMARRFNNSGSTALQFRTVNNGTIVEAVHIKSNGSVGIGTTSPTAQLEVKGTYDGQSHVVINSTSSTNTGGPELQFAFNNVGKGFAWYVPYADALGFGRGNSNNSLFVVSSGNVGIGTLTPDEKLTVKGKVHAEEVLIDLAVPAPDYVFEKDYSLTPLSEVQAYISQHKHLPEVPSAKEMETNGVKVGEMEMILLKKIEELTLHLISKDEQLKKLEERLERLEKK